MARRYLDNKPTPDAQMAAQRLAFGPLMFQAARALRTTGVLEHLKLHGVEGSTPHQVAEATGFSLYSVRVMLEAGLAAEMLELAGDRFVLTKLGYLVLMDPMTRVNFDFVHDVCYRPAFHLEAALREGKPTGLKELGPWPTVYQGLSELPDAVRQSWLAFDHFYSDNAIHEVSRHVLATSPQRLADIGGNTGRCTLRFCEADAAVQVTLVDLPQQVHMARENIAATPHADRVSFWPTDVLSADATLPPDHDALWMSQFLDCFSEAEIVHILRCAARVMSTSSRLFVMETLWDKQRHEAARFSVINTSLYFTAVANGNSKMMHSERLLACASEAGLTLVEEHHPISISHTLLVFRRAG